MSFTITVSNQETQFICQPGQSILDAALNQGIILSYGCRDGMCGSCRGSVISGSFEYPQGNPGGISAEEIAQGEALFCKAVPTSDLHISARVLPPASDIEVKTLPARVKSIDYVSDDVIRLMLQLPAMEEFAFKAGQWIYVLLKDGRKRAFSLANTPAPKSDLELHIRHAVGGVFTDFVFQKLNVGDLLRIEGPHGSFNYQPADRPVLLVAGGTGFAPVKGIFEHLTTLDSRPPVHLFWGARRKKDLYMNQLVEQWQRDFGLHYTPVLSAAMDSDGWNGATGLVHEAVLERIPNLAEYSVYMAGPPQMIEACRQGFIAAGLDETDLLYDSFEYSSDARDAMEAG